MHTTSEGNPRDGYNAAALDTDTSLINNCRALKSSDPGDLRFNLRKLSYAKIHEKKQVFDSWEMRLRSTDVIQQQQYEHIILTREVGASSLKRL